jgi:outer membrane protein assembly factor BamB
LSDYGSLLQRHMDRAAPPSFTLADLGRRQGRRKRNQRIASAALGLVLVAALLLVLGRGLGGLGHRERLPASPAINPSNVSRLEVSWTGSLDAGPVTSPTISGDSVFVGNGENVRSFSSGCNRTGGRCAARWAGDVDGQIDDPVTASGGVVYVGSRSLTAFPASCETEATTCKPLWTTMPIGGGHAVGTPAVSNGVAYVSTGKGALYAFPASCRTDGGICHPSWVGRTGMSMHLSAPVVSGGLVYVASNRLYAFSTRCAVRSCGPVWSGALRSQAFDPPVAANGTIYVGADALYAFHARCRATPCRASWTWRPPGGATINAIAVSGSEVFVVADRLYALPIGCSVRATCRPSWETSAQPFSVPTIADGLVFVTTDRLWAFPTLCSTRLTVCKPVWVSPALDAGIPLSPPAITRSAVYVTTSGRLYALAIPGGSTTG